MTEAPATAAPAPPGRALPAALLAWAIPGAGHLYLRRPARAAIFFALVIAALVLGAALDGNLYRTLRGQPLATLATLASMGAGAPYFVLRYGFGHQGDPVSWGYEYGTAFLLTAGLMNLLLVLDAWDIARGHKE
jgi:hypothetical protein